MSAPARTNAFSPLRLLTNAKSRLVCPPMIAVPARTVSNTGITRTKGAYCGALPKTVTVTVRK